MDKEATSKSERMSSKCEIIVGSIWWRESGASARAESDLHRINRPPDAARCTGVCVPRDKAVLVRARRGEKA